MTATAEVGNRITTMTGIETATGTEDAGRTVLLITAATATVSAIVGAIVAINRTLGAIEMMMIVAPTNRATTTVTTAGTAGTAATVATTTDRGTVGTAATIPTMVVAKGTEMGAMAPETATRWDTRTGSHMASMTEAHASPSVRPIVKSMATAIADITQVTAIRECTSSSSARAINRGTNADITDGSFSVDHKHRRLSGRLCHLTFFTCYQPSRSNAARRTGAPSRAD